MVFNDEGFEICSMCEDPSCGGCRYNDEAPDDDYMLTECPGCGIETHTGFCEQCLYNP